MCSCEQIVTLRASLRNSPTTRPCIVLRTCLSLCVNVHVTKNAPLIGSAQAAKVFDVDRATFNRWVAEGRIPVVAELDGTTGARLFDADAIDQLAAQGGRPPRMEDVA